MTTQDLQSIQPSSDLPIGRAAAWRGRIPLGLVFLAVLASHWYALRAPFFADDYLFLEQCRGRSLPAALLSPDPIGNYFRPVSRVLYFWLFSNLGGGSALVFHVVNLSVCLALIALVYQLGRRLAGHGVGIIAAGFVGLHYATDVPVLWVSGAQDLLAATAGVGALLLYSRGQRAWSAALLAVALLSKESAAVVPLIALWMDGPRDLTWGGRVRRAWPLLAVGALWVVVWLATASSRPATAAAMSADISALPAALWHLLQVAVGLEIGPGASDPGLWVRAGLAAMAIVAAVALVADRRDPVDGDRAMQFGMGWAIVAALPVVVVASIWSAYFYLFALCGAGIALGGFLQRRPMAVKATAMVLLALGSANARQLRTFAAGGAWAAHSHVNRFYVERGMDLNARLVRELKELRPSFPAASAIFFADLPSSSGFQTGDGPFIRWAYGDSSLRSYYLTEFSADRIRGRQLFFFALEDTTLVDHSVDPDMLASAAYSMILDDKPAAARAALLVALDRTPDDRVLRYWLAWTQWSLGDTTAARENLERAGVRAIWDRGTADRASHALANQDTVQAVATLLAERNRAGLVPAVHARLAAICLASGPHAQLGVIEAYALTVLSPREPDVWRKWASAQLHERRYAGAARSLERYFALRPDAAGQDPEAQRVLASLQELLEGSDRPQQTPQ